MKYLIVDKNSRNSSWLGITLGLVDTLGYCQIEITEVQPLYNAHETF